MEVAGVLDARETGEFRHPAFFYSNPTEYLEYTLSFISVGLAADEAVAVAVPGPNLRLIATELGADTERVTLLDMARAGRNPGRIIPSVLRAFTDAHIGRRVRVIGEPIWAGRTGMEYGACAQHEALINMAFHDRLVSILCPYDVRRLTPGALADARATHPELVDAGGRRVSADYAPHRIIARYNHPLVAPADAPKIGFRATTLPRTRRFAVEQAIRFGFRGRHTELELIVGELTSNSVTHGGGAGTLSVWSEQGQLVCEVRDSGHITDPLAGRRPVSRTEPHGRGLLLVNQLADLVRTHTGPAGTTIRAYLWSPYITHAPSPALTAASSATDSGPSLDDSPMRAQISDALRVASRFAEYLPPAPGSARRTIPCDVDSLLEALGAANVLAEVVDLWRARLVSLARQEGARWSDIGSALGVSKQAAHERYGRLRRRGAGGRGDGRSSH